MLTIISIFQELIKGVRDKSEGLENIAEINERGGHSVLENRRNTKE